MLDVLRSLMEFSPLVCIDVVIFPLGALYIRIPKEARFEFY